MKAIIRNTKNVKGAVRVPGDKSISHRSLIFGAMAEGETVIKNFLMADDCLRTMEGLRSAGTHIAESGGSIYVTGKRKIFNEPENVIYCGNSGTTMRLLAGLFASQPFYTVMSGDNSLSSRPMGRIVEPLVRMGAGLFGRKANRYPPLAIRGNTLHGINYRMPVASAQVKSSIIIAALSAGGTTIVEEPILSRDHTERILISFGGKLEKEGLSIMVPGNQNLRGIEIEIPGDFSSAAYFMAAAAMVKNSRIRIEKVGLNPTRTGFAKVLARMGAGVSIFNESQEGMEPVGDIEVSGSGRLKGVEILPCEVPGVIDEIPLLATVASMAEGKTLISGASELKLKESDRLLAISTELNKMGSDISTTDDGLIINGVEKLGGTKVESWGDHRIAMSLAIAALAAEGETIVNDFDCVNISFPSFPSIMSECGPEIVLVKDKKEPPLKGDSHVHRN